MAFLMLSVTEDQWSMEGTELGTGQSLSATQHAF